MGDLSIGKMKKVGKFLLFIIFSPSVIIQLINRRYNLAIVRGKGFPKTIRRVP